MRISILCFDLAHNCLGRAYLLAKVLQRRYEVEVLGTVFPEHGGGIWKPCDTGELDYQVFEGGKLPFYVGSMRRLARAISGDVIYACKPRLPSFGVALLKKLSGRRRVLLDIDDRESAWFTRRDWKRVRRMLRNPVGPLYTRCMEKLVRFADDVTTVSSDLQREFGGVIIPHGRDTQCMDPARFQGDKGRCG